MIGITIDTRDFDKTFQEYMRFTSRSMADAVNQHAYYIARNATRTTKAATAQDIRRDMLKTCVKHPPAPLAAVVVNRQLGLKNQKGLYGVDMSDAIERFLLRRSNYRNFLRSGWLAAVKKLDAVVPKRNGARIPNNTDRRKLSSLGGGYGAPTHFTNFNPLASIWNSISGKDPSKEPTVNKIITEGAQEAINLETDSMRKYIERKIDALNKELWRI